MSIILKNAMEIQETPSFSIHSKWQLPLKEHSLCACHWPTHLMFLLMFFLKTIVFLFLAVLDLSCSARASHYSGFLLQSMVEPRLELGSVVMAYGLSCCGTWDLPGPGIEPVSPALAGRFLSTLPPGKSQLCTLNVSDKSYLNHVTPCLTW